MRIRLLEKLHFQGHVYLPGEIVDLPEGMKGPMRSVRRTSDQIDYDPKNGIDANHVPGDIVDEPLYEEVKDEAKP